MAIHHRIAGKILEISTPKEIKERARAFRHALESERRKIIIYTDTDADGHGAGANLATALGPLYPMG